MTVDTRGAGPRFLAHVQGNDWTVPQLTDEELLALEAALSGGVTGRLKFAWQNR